MSPRLVIIALLLGALGCASGASSQDPSPDKRCDVCDPAAECRISDGRAQCVCPTGYTDPNGNGTWCRDIDECATQNHECDDRAVCINRIGDYLCVCNEGYEGNGKVCRDINECAMGDACGANATCMNIDGGYMCRCNDGYAGDGQTCVDVDECASGRDQCDANATCTNDDGTYTCACNDGYIGDGFACDDIDECALELDECSGLTVCRNLPGGFDCVCAPGYLDEHGDGSSCLRSAAGRIYLIGHDYFTSNDSSNRLLGNAIFSANTSGTVHILGYTQYADNRAGQEVASVNAAINARAAELGRQFTLTTLNDYTELTQLLLGKHVLLIYEQEDVPGPSVMTNIGQIWSLTLQTFVKAGGIVVVTDFTGDTWRVLTGAELMSITSSTSLSSDVPLTVLEPGDPAAAGVSATYPAPTGSRTYASSNGFPLVADPNGKSVVLVRSLLDRCVTIEDFEAGTWPLPGWISPSGGSLGTVRASAAHDFAYGVSSPSWHYQTRILPSNVGDRIRGWVKLTGHNGRVNIGFGASRLGAYSVELNASTSKLYIQRNTGYGAENLQETPFAVQVNAWYMLEIQYGGGGLVTVRVYTDASPAPISTLSTTVTGLGIGGTGLRGFFGADIDTLQACGAP